MNSKIMRLLLGLVAPVLSGALLVLAFPPFDLGWLAWVGFLPLLIVISGRSPKFGFFSSYLCGAVFFLGFFDWILDVSGYKFYHHIILAVYLGAYFASFGLIFSLIYKRWSVAAAHLAAPFIWVSLEYVRSHLSFLALPTPLLGHSQYQYLSIIQIANVTGVYGISFLILLGNSALSLMILFLLLRSGQLGGERFSPVLGRQVFAVLLASMTLTGATILKGQIALSKPIVGKEIRISLLQGNIDRTKKWNPKYAKYIMQTYEDMTQEASAYRPDLIIWPEASTPRSITRDRRLDSEVRRIAETSGAFLLLGSTQVQKIKGKGKKGATYRNSAFLINPKVRTKHQRYDKIRLLPFGEYLPLKETIPWSYLGVPDMGSFTPGKEHTIFEGPGFRFGVFICWESIFPELVREFAQKGAQVLINITNEGWFGETAPYQYLAINTFRAVENRLFLVRCANTGISCFIDPCGRILDRVRGENGSDILVRGILNGTVIPLESKTIYGRYGDWLAWLSIVCSVLMLVIVFVKRYSTSSG